MSYSKSQAEFIPDGGINKVIADWHAKQPPREQTCASPSTLQECPRVVWLKKKQVKPVIPMGWGKLQRMLLGRNFENKIAEQLRESGNLLYHWKDNVPGESVKFSMGEGLTHIEGTPDLLLRLGDTILISDAKTSRSDSFGFVGLSADEAFEDKFWHKYKLQVEAYYLLCYKNKDWFKKHGLLLPEACHLFSFALDDGIVRREFTWKPTKETAQEIFKLAKRWNSAYQSETLPECLCKDGDKKFCYYRTKEETTRRGAKLGVDCCNEELRAEIKV